MKKIWIVLFITLVLAACDTNNRGERAPAAAFCPDGNWKMVTHVHTSMNHESRVKRIILCVLKIEEVKNPWNKKK